MGARASHRWSRLAAVTAAVSASVVTGCGSEPLDRELPHPEQRLTVSSASIHAGAFSKNATCNGAGQAPGVRWSDLPQQTAEIAVLVVDRDGEGGELLHSVLYGINPHTSELEPNVTPPDVHEGKTSFGRTNYEPICPPKGGAPHHYAIEVYALRDDAELRDGAAIDEVLEELDRLALARGTAEGLYRNTQ